MEKKRKFWIDKLLSASDDVSSKRVAGLLVLVNIIAFCYMAILRNLVLPDFMFESICFLAGGLLGLTTVENVFNKKKDPPSDPPTEQPQ